MSLDSGPSGDSYGAAIALALMGICIVAFVITRAGAVRRTFDTSRHKADADLLLLKLVARAQRMRVAMLGAVGGVVLGAIGSRWSELEIPVAWCVTPGLVIAISLFTLWRLQQLLALQADPGLHISAHGDFLFVARGTRLVGWVAAPPLLVARATSLPVAKLTGDHGRPHARA